MAKKLNVSFPDDLWATIEAEAEEKDRTVQDVIRDCVMQTLSEQRWQGVGEFVTDAILRGHTNGEILDMVHERMPHAKTSPASVSWYRTKLRREGKDVMTDAEARLDRQARLAGK